MPDNGIANGSDLVRLEAKLDFLEKRLRADIRFSKRVSLSEEAVLKLYKESIGL